jgi:AraC-like DNA-binding protein
MDETVFDWELAGRIRDHQTEGNAIAERLKEQGPLVIDRLLNFYGWETSLRQLAKDAGVSATYLSRIHRGHFVISPGLFALLSDMLQDRTQHERLTARKKDRIKAGRCRSRKDLRQRAGKPRTLVRG